MAATRSYYSPVFYNLTLLMCFIILRNSNHGFFKHFVHLKSLISRPFALLEANFEHMLFGGKFKFSARIEVSLSELAQSYRTRVG